MLYSYFHVSLGDKTDKRYFALESPGFEFHTDILSLVCVIFYVVSIITARQRTLLMKILICEYIICDRPFPHMGQEYPFLWLSKIFLSLPACLILGLNCCLKLSINAILAASWQNKQNCMCAQRILRLAWASAQSDQSSLSTWRMLASLACSYPLNAQHSEDSGQTGRMPRLIWVLAGRTIVWLVLSGGASCIKLPSSGGFRSQWPPESRRVPRECNCWGVCSYIDARELLQRMPLVAIQNLARWRSLTFVFNNSKWRPAKLCLRLRSISRVQHLIRKLWCTKVKVETSLLPGMTIFFRSKRSIVIFRSNENFI